jgi:hypothetical protein
MMLKKEIKEIVSYSEKKLDYKNLKLSDEYYYHSLPMCVMDAVFSIGIKYTTTRKVVINFCEKTGLKRLRKYGSNYPNKNEQFSINDLIDIYEKNGLDQLTKDYYKNKNLTSSKNGILKSEAVLLFCKVLNKFDINYFQDINEEIIKNKNLENEIKKIKGQKSGISFKYFLMLAGEENLIKPDRMIKRYIKDSIGREVDDTESLYIIVESAKSMGIKPRELDHQIWNYQRLI